MSCIAEDRSRYDKRKQGECNASVETERGTNNLMHHVNMHI